MKLNVFSIKVSGLIAAAFMVTACGASTALPSVTETVSVGVTETVAYPAATETVAITTTVSAPEIQETTPSVDLATIQLQQKNTYLFSDSRISRLEEAFVPAAEKIARALLANELGDVRKYDSYKQDKADDYVGWGGISTFNYNAPDQIDAYAWVYWAGNGTIDFSKGIGGASIDPGEAGARVQIESSPNSNEPWLIFLDDASNASESHRFSGFADNDSYCQDTDEIDYACTVDEAISLDNDAIYAWNANMIAVFGSDWRNN